MTNPTPKGNALDLSCYQQYQSGPDVREITSHLNVNHLALIKWIGISKTTRIDKVWTSITQASKIMP